MGNRFSRRRYAPASCAAAATEQKTEAGPARTDQDQNPEPTQTRELVETEKLDVLVDESGTTQACSPKHESVSGSEEVALVPQNDAESAVKETPPPVQIEPLIPAIKPPEHEGLAQPALVAEAQLALKPEPESSSHQEAEAEPISEPAPTTAEPLEQHTDLLNQESLPPLIDSSVPDVSFAPASIPASLNPGESWNISAERVEPAGGSSLEPEEFTETSEFVEKQVEVEAAGCVETTGSDVIDENVCGDLKNLELEGNDLLNDLIQSEVKMSDDAPFTDVSASIEQM